MKDDTELSTSDKILLGTMIASALSVIAAVVLGYVNHRDTMEALAIARDSMTAASRSAEASQQSALAAKEANGYSRRSAEVAEKSYGLAEDQIRQTHPAVQLTDCGPAKTIDDDAPVLYFSVPMGAQQVHWQRSPQERPLRGLAYRCSLSNVGKVTAFRVSMQFRFHWAYFPSQQKPPNVEWQDTVLALPSLAVRSVGVPALHVYFVDNDTVWPMFFKATGSIDYAQTDDTPPSPHTMISYPGSDRQLNPIGEKLTEMR